MSDERKVNLTDVGFRLKLGMIPREMYRVFEGGPFAYCDVCARDLLEFGTEYLISKYYLDGELQQELASCSVCQQVLADLSSLDSADAMLALLMYAELDEREQLVVRPGAVSFAQMIAVCVLCDLPREEAGEYYLYAACRDEKIVYAFYPAMICGECSGQIFKVMSQDTKDARKAFFGEHFGLPPMHGKAVDAPVEKKLGDAE